MMTMASVDSAQRACARITSPRRVLGLMGAGLSLIAFARVFVLVAESYSAVWSERQADRDLMRMCDDGTASMSADFRALCLKKRAEQSAPILLKAVLRACATAFADFCESMSSPTKVVLLLLFCLTGVAAPVVKALAALVVDHMRRRKRRRRGRDTDSDDESDDEDGHHEIVIVSPNRSMNDAAGMAAVPRMLGARLRRSARNLRRSGSGASPRAGPIMLSSLEDDEPLEPWDAR